MPSYQSSKRLDVSHVEITFPFGRREVVSSSTYAELSDEALAGTRVRLLSRREVIRRRVKDRRRAS